MVKVISLFLMVLTLNGCSVKINNNFFEKNNETSWRNDVIQKIISKYLSEKETGHCTKEIKVFKIQNSVKSIYNLNYSKIIEITKKYILKNKIEFDSIKIENFNSSIFDTEFPFPPNFVYIFSKDSRVTGLLVHTNKELNSTNFSVLNNPKVNYNELKSSSDGACELSGYRILTNIDSNWKWEVEKVLINILDPR